MTRTTETTTRRLDRIEGLLEALISTQAPAKPVSPRVVSAKPKLVALCRATRVDFIRASDEDFSGMSTQAIAAMCVEDPTLVPEGFRIGTRYTEKFSA